MYFIEEVCAVSAASATFYLWCGQAIDEWDELHGEKAPTPKPAPRPIPRCEIHTLSYQLYELMSIPCTPSYTLEMGFYKMKINQVEVIKVY